MARSGFTRSTNISPSQITRKGGKGHPAPKPNAGVKGG